MYMQKACARLLDHPWHRKNWKNIERSWNENILDIQVYSLMHRILYITMLFRYKGNLI